MKKTLRKLTLAALVAGATAFAATTAPTQAATSSNCTYYSDASHATVVGQYGKDCCNNTVAWGVKTQYSVCGGCFICYPPPPR
ncbi:MAG TPA: DUF6289 family protein [Thermoanaerobaculia bacterium]